ncbi:transport protein Trs120 or TRAPPC9 TRAPP II complex subunit-domain-containing protein [Podospora appendiculata]|uniref:Transport protein Trs120 or TRAPPC9 TRAPP II complex subunit-domain-containing protein n=1 Tax=Podospora appendiculata TaxID=314037 RepID=A0AAE0WYJ6_9PEZI|nr:transport protein Trs120 or TRAPPC9 TRAPP II complex subunit-domain-containing protein [Podospora appendiculata]
MSSTSATSAPMARPNRNMFSPLAFPAGAMFYELMTHLPPPSHLALSPFDLYREPLALIAVADGSEISSTVLIKRQSGGRTVEETNIRGLYQELEELRDHYPRILVHQVLLFDYLPAKDKPLPIPEGITTIPPAEHHVRTTMKTVMCDISSLVLAEMTTLAKSFEGGIRSTPLPAISRSSSASGIPDRSHVRMSMPVVGAMYGSSNSTPGRPSTPVNGRSGLSHPPTTFDDITERDGSDPDSPEQQPPGFARPGTAEGFRTQSQDRVTVQGFGPGGLNERWRNKGKSRVQIVLGSLYLQAGRWSDAIKELRIQFQVPTVLLPPPEKGNIPSLTAAIQEAENRDPNQPRWLRNLQVYMPELIERIIASYSRISAEHLPPLPLCEAIIRFCKMLTALHVAGGPARSSIPGHDAFWFNIFPYRTQIVATLFRAFPASSSEVLTTIDRIVILSGIASVLGVLGFQRKKAMVVRELVSVLIGGLVEARTRGAADVGIHPAAGLMAVNGHYTQANGASVSLELEEGDIEYGIDAFLSLLLKTYGVVSGHLGSDTTDDSDAAVLARIQKQSALRSFGLQSVKLNILRACINFSEALPDFNGVLKFSSDLLRTAGSGVAPGPRRENVYPAITKDEQVRLASNISKTSNLSTRLGVGHLAAEYWDEFLLRGVRLEPVSAIRTPIPHARSVLPDAATARASQDVDPFIYNPFLKRPDAAAVESILVAGETATFRLTLQNPYEIDVDVESVRLDTEGAEFESTVESTLIGPYRTQILRISGVPKSAGTLKITGAVIKVRGCRERRFPIFHKPWGFDNDIKVKAIGLASLEVSPAAPSLSIQRLVPDQLELNVIAQQPVVVVKSSTLPQSSVMILEGERQSFSVTLHNTSTTTPVDFILFSFKDSTQEQLQIALDSRNATPAELYEYELELARKQALRLRKRGSSRRYIAPGGTSTFDFEILGKPGLTNGVIQVNYAHLGVPYDEVGEKFYTRQASLELTVTVNASVEVVRMDILPLHGSIPEPLWLRTGYQEKSATEVTEDTHCLLLLDLRNAWPSQMHVTLQTDDGAKVDEQILPGNTSRVILPLKRVYLDDPHMFIPALNPTRQRQFVLSTKISPDLERANREAFWYREKLLDSLKGTWRAAASSGGRSGNIELRAMRLTSRMIEAVKIDEVDIKISLVDPSSTDAGSGDAAARDSTKNQTLFTDEFFQVQVHIRNRTDQPIYPLLRLMPALCHRPLNVALDFTRKFAWNGTLQQVLPLLAGGASTTVATGVTALCRGEFEMTASVEETRLWTMSEEEERRKRESGALGAERVRSEVESLADAALGRRERRIWHTRRACKVVVRDRK